jgi:hypothetical protein
VDIQPLKSKVLIIRVDEATFAWLGEYRQRTGVNVSEAIRRAVQKMQEESSNK